LFYLEPQLQKTKKVSNFNQNSGIFFGNIMEDCQCFPSYFTDQAESQGFSEKAKLWV